MPRTPCRTPSFAPWSTVPDRPGSQPPWLHSVLRNIAIDRLRRKRLESVHTPAVLAPEESSEHLIEIRAQCEAALHHLLSRVSFAQAAVILLRDVFELDYPEIARLLGKKPRPHPGNSCIERERAPATRVPRRMSMNFM